MSYSLTYDQWMAALCIWREARGSTMPQMNAVYHVILNRTQDAAGRWPKVVSDVVTQKYQFSSFNADDPNVTKFPTPKNVSEWDAWQRCLMVVTNPLGDDPTGGANSYHTIPDGGYTYKDNKGNPQHLNPPTWATQNNFKCEIGPFKFYKV